MAERVAPSELRDISYTDLTAKMITEAAKKGDEIALEAFELTGRILGVKLADAITFSSPSTIFLFGGLAKAGDLLLEPVKRYMTENLFSIYRNKINVKLSALQETNAAVLGASALAWNELNQA